MVKVSASILGSDLSNLAVEAARVEKAGATALVSAKTIFSSPDMQKKIRELKS